LLPAARTAWWLPPVLTLVPDGSIASRARSSGARGLLSREASGERIASALAAVLDGSVVPDDEVAEVLLRRQEATALPSEPLTPASSRCFGCSQRAMGTS